MVEQYSDVENFNLVMNFICPKCYGITSQGTFFIKEELKIVNTRICYHCFSTYSVTTIFDDIEKFTIFQDTLIKNIKSRNIKTRTFQDEELKQVTKATIKLFKKINKCKINDSDVIIGEGGFNN